MIVCGKLKNGRMLLREIMVNVLPCACVTSFGVKGSCSHTEDRIEPFIKIKEPIKEDF